MNAPEKIVAELQGCWDLESGHLTAEWVARAKDLADRAVLSTGIAGLEETLAFQQRARPRAI